MLEIPVCTMRFPGLGAKSPHPVCQPGSRKLARRMNSQALIRSGARVPTPRISAINATISFG
jgi:hypothetical protein